MDLPQTTEYALRALAFIATLPPGRLASATGVAVETNVPVPYLHKVLRRLVNAGLLVVKKGRGGGFALASPPEEVRILDVLDAMDSPLSERCAFGFGRCDGNNPCLLHAAHDELRGAIRSWASSTTLAMVRDYARTRPIDGRKQKVRKKGSKQ